ncbi:hypothetical protein [Trinickia fusca]|uniref:Uncharacterized protein n=1 Tax=Trinickia fusca TaxID=2419777 RepID=A0A494XKK4_9BURK|nr:hypothetical protein [Trinickia fusca]RKP51245.1 hypothetical protein D7S89_06650 [Trinickia fusca]
MNLHIHNADLVAIVALALLASLLLATRFKPKTWVGIVFEALLANLAAIATVIAFEAMLS